MDPKASRADADEADRIRGDDSSSMNRSIRAILVDAFFRIRLRHPPIFTEFYTKARISCPDPIRGGHYHPDMGHPRICAFTRVRGRVDTIQQHKY